MPRPGGVAHPLDPAPPPWSCSQVKVLHTKRPRQLMRRGKDIYARGSSGKAGGVIRHCRKVKANRGSVFQPTLRMAGLPITLRSLVQCAIDEKAAELSRRLRLRGRGVAASWFEPPT